MEGTLRPAWDGNNSNRVKLANWGKHLEHMAKPESYVGELEFVAAAEQWAISIIVVRPKLQSIRFGSGKLFLWIKLEAKHCEPLDVVRDTITSAAKKQHVKDIHDIFDLPRNPSEVAFWDVTE